MDIVSILVYLCIGTFLLFLFAGVLLLIFFPMYKEYAAKQRRQKLLATGAQAPATILASKFNFTSESTSTSFLGIESSEYSHNVSFDLEVTPKDRPVFRTKLKTFVHSYEPELIDPGNKIWIRYDPNDITQIAFEYFDSEKAMILEEPEWKLKRDAFLALESKYVKLRETGEKAPAVILEKEKIIDIETSFGKGTVYRLKFDITPSSGVPFQAEAQAVLVIDKRYAVGKKVTVCFDPGDRSLVALDGTTESTLSNAKSLFTVSLR